MELQSTGHAIQASDIDDWARHLGIMTQNLRANHPDATVIEFSTYKLFDSILSNPKAYKQTAKLQNMTDFCNAYSGYVVIQATILPILMYVHADININSGTLSGNTLIASCRIPADEYFWLNSLHPTFPVHQALAAEVSLVLKNTATSQVCGAQQNVDGTKQAAMPSARLKWRGRR
jgi:phospholipase/lecithinase/hemolysin